ATVAPGALFRITFESAVDDAMVRPPSEVITSPAWIPVLAAGDLGTPPLMIAPEVEPASKGPPKPKLLVGATLTPIIAVAPMWGVPVARLGSLFLGIESACGIGIA